MTRLDDSIIDVGGLISLLLVFITGYLAGIWPQIESAVGTPAPPVAADKRSLAGRLRSYRALVRLVFALDIGIIAIVTPLLLALISDLSIGAPYSALRAGFVLLYLYLLVVLGTIAALHWRLSNRIGVLQSLAR